MKAIIIIIVVAVLMWLCNASEQTKYDKYMEDVPEGDREYHQRKK